MVSSPGSELGFPLEMEWSGGMQIHILTNNKKGKRTLIIGIFLMFLIASDTKHSKATLLSHCMWWKTKA